MTKINNDKIEVNDASLLLRLLAIWDRCASS